MNLQPPSIATLAQEILSDIQLGIAKTASSAKRAFLLVLSMVVAGAVAMLYRYVNFSHLQQYPRYCSAKPVNVAGRTITPLNEWGDLLGVEPQRDATSAVLDVAVPVLAQTGNLARGALLIYSPTNVVYSVLDDVPLDAATVTARVVATSDQEGNAGKGLQGNLPVGAELSFTGPVPNVASLCAVSAIVTVAAEAEETESHRERVLDEMAARKRGGQYADFAAWAKLTPGIINAYPYTNATPATYGVNQPMIVFVEASVSSSEDPDGIPTSPQLVSCQETMNANTPPLAPCAVLPIERLAFDVEITGLTDAALKPAIEAALDEFYRSKEPFIVGLSRLPAKNLAPITSVVGLVDQIVSSAGAAVGLIEQYSDSQLNPSGYLAINERAKLGTVTYF